MSVLCAGKGMLIRSAGGDEVGTLTIDQIKSANNCTVGSDGTVTVTGNDAYLIFQPVKLSAAAQSVRVDCAAVAKPSYAQLYYSKNANFSEKNSVQAYVAKSVDSFTFFLPADSYRYLRLDVDNDYILNGIHFFSGIADAPVTVSGSRYLFSALIAALAAVVMGLLEKRFFISARISAYFRRNRFHIISTVIVVAVLLGFGLVLELVIGRFLSAPLSDGSTFSVYRYVFICGLLLTFYLVVAGFRSFKEKPENMVLGLTLILGTVILFLTPFGHACWDTDVHYKWALSASYPGMVYTTEADSQIMSGGGWMQFGKAKNDAQISQFNDMGKVITGVMQPQTTIAHLPGGLFIALTRFFGGSFYWQFTMGKLPNLLLYAFIGYFAIKKLKSGKIIAAIILLFPTNLFLAANYSYDYWVTSLSILGMAYFIGEAQRPDQPVTTAGTVIMCGAFALACIPKPVYAPLLLLPFLLKKNNFKIARNRKRYRRVCLLMFVIFFCVLLAIALSSVGGSGDTRGGSGVNPAGQLTFILTHPLVYADILINFLKNYLSPAFSYIYMTELAYVGQGSGFMVILTVLILAILTDKSQPDRYSSRFINKAAVILLYFLGASLVATTLYLMFNNVGENGIRGCQYRYLMPLIYPFCSLIGPGRLNNRINRSFYNFIMLAIPSGVVWYNIYSMLLSAYY